MTKKEFLKKFNLTEDQFSGKEKIIGDLRMQSYNSHPLPAGFNPTVGGDLRMDHSSKYIGVTVPPLNINKNFFWDVKEKKYAKIDGIFCEITGERQNTTNEVIYTVYSGKKVGRNEHFYIVNQGPFYAHGTELSKAYEDLQFKMVSEKLRKEPILPDTLLTVKHYRLITGACDMGCRGFLDRNKIPYHVVGDTTVEDKPIKAKDLLPLLEKNKEYGYEKIKSLIIF